MDRIIAAGVILLAFGAVLTVPGVLESGDKPGKSSSNSISTFRSAQHFREVVRQREGSGGYTADLSMERVQATAMAADSGSSGQEVKRFSETNVQEQGVDEPDILKTDGENFYFSPEDSDYRVLGAPEFRTGMPGYFRPVDRNTSVFDAFPPENFSETSKIPANGRLLLQNETLIVMGDENITAFDVSSPENPEKSWKMSYNGSIVTARVTDGEVFLILKEYVGPDTPCPVKPLRADSAVSIPCSSIYYPESGEIDSTYTVVSFNLEGEVESRTSFAASSSNSNVYMSKDSIYITYLKEKSRSEIMIDFLKKDRGIFDSDTRKRIQRVMDYNLSRRAKFVELQNIMDDYRQKLERQGEKNFREKFQNRIGNYTEDNKRKFQKTGIVRIESDSDLEVDRQGEVPGKVLDQFSMDEKNGTLRIATTVGGWFGFDVKSENDLYTLDGEELEIKGSVRGMGLTERIYSTRFIRDRAYVVTFRRIDPFHVIDLSDPENPELKGKLKLPGFSSYLHPLGEDRILGIGEENNSVKAVIFDVSDAEDPVVEESVVIDEYSSEISDTHHAFLIDRKHKIFFLPGSEKGYIFSYSDGLEKLKEVELKDPKRARYINDYLYIFGSEEAAVLNEETWKEVKRIGFRGEREGNEKPRLETIR